MISYFLDVMRIFGKADASSWCSAGRRDLAMIFIQCSKLVLVFLAVVVYEDDDYLGILHSTATRPWDPSPAWVRHAYLFVIMVLSWIVAGICIFTDFYKPKGYTMFFAMLLDRDLAEAVTPICYVTVVSLLGLLEKVRPYCEDHSDIESPNSE